MEKIASFQVDHTKFSVGMYISRIDGDIVTYDVRMVKPNGGVYLETPSMHTIEHLFATFARNSEFGHTKIKEGEIIALNNGKLTNKEKDPVKAVVKLAKEMISRDTSYVSLIYGNGITETQANAAVEAIEAKTGGNIEVSLIDGGQPIYYFILSVE